MYSVCVRDHMMIAHSFRGEIFGPAQRLHGATYVVDVEFRRPELDPEGLVVDIGRAAEALRGLLAEMNYRNLDETAEFAARNTTTERGRMRSGEVGAAAAGVTGLRVVLHESHVAWAAYEGSVIAEAADRHAGTLTA